jgi:hypothetical protein
MKAGLEMSPQQTFQTHDKDLHIVTKLKDTGRMGVPEMPSFLKIFLINGYTFTPD